MKLIKQYLGYIIAFLSTIIGFLLFLLFRKNKENESIKADLDLAVQSERSKVVDEKVNSAQKEIDKLSQEIEKPVSKDNGEIDKFWDDYDKDSK